MPRAVNEAQRKIGVRAIPGRHSPGIGIVAKGVRRDGTSLERGAMPGRAQDGPAQTFLRSPAGERLAKAILENQRIRLAGALSQGAFQFQREGFEQRQNWFLAAFAVQAGGAGRSPMNILLPESQSLGNPGSGVIEKTEEQTVAAPVLGGGVGGGQNGLDFRDRQGLDQWTVKAFERDGQHLAGQGQRLGRLLRDVAHKGAQRRQANVAGAGLATSLLFQVIQEVQDSQAVPILKGLLTGRPPGLLLDEGQQ